MQCPKLGPLCAISHMHILKSSYKFRNLLYNWHQSGLKLVDLGPLYISAFCTIIILLLLLFIQQCLFQV